MSVNENLLREYLENTIKEIAGRLKEDARSVAEKKGHTYDGTHESARKVLWEDTDAPELAHICGQVGMLVALFDTATSFSINFPKEVEDLFKWTEVIDAVTRD